MRELVSMVIFVKMANVEFPASEESDSEAGPPQKKAKFTGVFKYKTKFSNEWKKTWPFVAAVRLLNPNFPSVRLIHLKTR